MSLNNRLDLERELISLGLLDKAKEIYSELGERAVLSYIKSSYRLLSKISHPDLNPQYVEKAKDIQQRLNKVNKLISLMQDEEIVELIKKGTKKPEKTKILVVEDEFGLQDMFMNVFLMEGYDVRVAVDGNNGFEVFCQFDPDLVFTDVIMPNVSGLELAAKIREINPQIKIIYISGFYGLESIKRDLDEDMLRFGYPSLSKPFKISYMLEVVKTYLADRPVFQRGVF